MLRSPLSFCLRLGVRLDARFHAHVFESHEERDWMDPVTGERSILLTSFDSCEPYRCETRVTQRSLPLPLPLPPKKKKRKRKRSASEKEQGSSGPVPRVIARAEARILPPGGILQSRTNGENGGERTYSLVDGFMVRK